MSKPITHRTICDYGDYSVEVKFIEDIKIRKSMVKEFNRNSGSIYFTTELIIMPKLNHINLVNCGKYQVDEFWKSQTGIGSLESLYNARVIFLDLINKIIPKYKNDVCIIASGSNNRRNRIYEKYLKSEGFWVGDFADGNAYLHKWYGDKGDKVYPKIKYQ